MTTDRLSALLHDAPPEQGPALEPAAVLRAARRRQARHRALAGAAFGLAAVAVAVPALGALRGSDRPTTVPQGSAAAAVVGGDAGLGRLPVSPSVPPGADAAPPRPLPSDALLQISSVGGNGLGPQPAIPEIRLRVYADGTLLVSKGRDRGHRWQQTALTDAEMTRVRELAGQAGLAAGGRDYGTPTNSGFAGTGTVFVVNTGHGPAASLVYYGGTVNGVPSSDAGLTQAQREARARLAELTALLDAAAQRPTRAYAPTQWSRYAQPSPATAAIDLAAASDWTGSPLTDGSARADGLRCVPVNDVARDMHVSVDVLLPTTGQYRYQGTAWLVRYDEVLPGEQPCTALTQ